MAQEVTIKFSGDPAQLLAAINQMKTAHASAMATIRTETARTAQTQQATARGELSVRQQLAAAASLQRQRSAALIAQWKEQERAAARLAAGVQPVATNLQTITNIMRTLGSSVGVLQGPLNGLSGRFTSLGTLARTAGGEVEGVGTAATAAGSQVAAIAGPIGIAVVAIAALAAGSAMVVKTLFELAVAAADFRGKMFDLAQQTGVAVETLSTLEVAAQTTGGSIDSIAQSLVIFQGKLDEAQDSSSKAAIKFKELGISTADTETAFRDALLQISKMPEGFEQTNTAAELFGRRGGKQMLAILKELDGDLDAATARLRQMGLVISTEDAKAADEFNDQLAILQFQFRALLGQQVIPAALVALKSLSTLLTENKRSISALGQAIGFISNVVLRQFLVELQRVTTALVLLEAAAAVVDRLRGIERPALPNAVAGVGGVSQVAGLEGSAEGAKPGRAPRGGGRSSGKSDAQRELEQQLAFFKQLTGESRELQDAYDFLDGKIGALDTTTRKYAVAQAIANGELSKASAGLQQMARETAIQIDLNNKRIAAVKKLKDFEAEQNAAAKLVIEGEATHLEIAEAQIAAFKREGQVLEYNRELFIRLTASILQAAAAKERLMRAEITGPLVGGVEGDGSIRPGFEGDTPPPEMRPAIDQNASAIQQLGIAIQENLAGSTMAAATAGLQTMVEVFGQLGQAVGQVVESFVLYGTAGTSVRKVTAQILAGIAQQAAVKAVFELAEGFAALALAFFGLPNAGPSAQAHFTAAAIYGGIAGIAAVSGRAVAGNEFNKASAAPTTGGPKRSGGSGGSTAPVPVEQDRRAAGSGGGTFTLNLKVPDGWLGQEFRKDWNLNGETRLVVQTDGG